MSHPRGVVRRRDESPDLPSGEEDADRRSTRARRREARTIKYLDKLQYAEDDREHQREVEAEMAKLAAEEQEDEADPMENDVAEEQGEEEDPVDISPLFVGCECSNYIL